MRIVFISVVTLFISASVGAQTRLAEIECNGRSMSVAVDDIRLGSVVHVRGSEIGARLSVFPVVVTEGYVDGFNWVMTAKGIRDEAGGLNWVWGPAEREKLKRLYLAAEDMRRRDTFWRRLRRGGNETAEYKAYQSMTGIQGRRFDDVDDLYAKTLEDFVGKNSCDAVAFEIIKDKPFELECATFNSSPLYLGRFEASEIMESVHALENATPKRYRFSRLLPTTGRYSLCDGFREPR